MLTIRGILLDLDNTLLDDRYATDQGFRAFLSVHRRNDRRDLADELARWRAILDRNWKRFESGEISFLEQRRSRVREFLQAELSDADADDAYVAYQRGYERAWRLMPGVMEFLKQTGGMPKVIVTNGDREAQMRKVRTTTLDCHVIGVVTPSDCGHWKPSPVIFESALRMLGLPASDCLMIGDDIVRDIEPALRLGMRCFHVQPGAGLLDALDRA